MKTNGKKTSIFHFCFLLLIIIIYTNNTHHTVQAQELLFDTVDYSWSNYSQYSDRYYNWKNHDYVVELYGNDAADEGFGSVISMYGNILVVGTETGNKAYVYTCNSYVCLS